jgi:hypothetical protein
LGGLSGGNEVRGKVHGPTQGPGAQPKDKYPPPPPAPREPHLRYSIEDHTLRNPEGVTITDTGYSGNGQHRNKPASQDLENHGPIPEGNWRIEEITDPEYFKNTQLKPPVYRLVPDQDTEKRVGNGGMKRKPNSFLIHGDNRENDASQGCIILGKPFRDQLRKHQGEWIRVTK